MMMKLQPSSTNARAPATRSGDITVGAIPASNNGFIAHIIGIMLCQVNQGGTTRTTAISARQKSRFQFGTQGKFGNQHGRRGLTGTSCDKVAHTQDRHVDAAAGDCAMR